MKLAREFLEASADATPDKTALVCNASRWTYGQLEAEANRLAQAFLSRGIGRGDRVVLHLPNSPAAVVAIFAALKAGAVFVPINRSVKAEKLEYILRDCQASALLTCLESAKIPQVDGLKLVYTGDRQAPETFGLSSTAEAPFPSAPWVQEAKHSTQRPSGNNEESDLACLIYTSGSTGKPKGVMCEHRNVVFVSGSIIQYLENRPEDIVLNVLPLSFDYGLYQLLMTFRFGGTLVLEQSFTYPASILQRIEQERVTGLPGVPTMFQMLLEQGLETYDLSSLRYLTNTAAALPPKHLIALRRRFPQARIYSMYGLTETKRTLYLPPEQLDRRPGSVGIPIPGTEAWLEDAEGWHLKPGEVGELVIRGPHVMRGYWGDEQATRQRFRETDTGERLCHSGDLFRQDAEGYFYFVSRKDDIIKSRGEKVAPKEIESVLYEMEGVAEVAVIGVPDPLLGQAIKAFLVFDGQPPPARQVLAHCRAHLEEFMVPQQIEFRQSLPKNASGKIDKLALQPC